MKRGLVFKSVILMFLCFFAISSIISQQVYATTTGTQMYSGVDYSGQGTKITSQNLRSEPAVISGSYVRIPIYLGQYQNQQILTNDWIWHSWSDWSTTNNKTTNYNTYVGEGITEYNVESKQQYTYKRWNSQLTPVYTKYYITKYQGNQWWNFLSFITVESTLGYGGAIADHNITEKYTESRLTSYRGGYEYTGWEDGKPFTWPWEIAWEDTPKSTRTVYRYQSRWITWNPNTRNGNELVPLKYSLYQNGTTTPIQAGIKWKYEGYEKRFTKQKERNVIEALLADTMPHEKNLDIIQYYITSSNVKKAVSNNLQDYLLSNTVIDAALDFIIDEAFALGFEELALALGASKLAALVGPQALALLKVVTLAEDHRLALELSYALNTILEDTSKPLVLSFVYNTTDVVIPDRKFRTTTNYDKTYVSMLYDRSFAIREGLDYYIPDGADAFGTIQYMSEYNLKTEVLSKINNYTWETIFLR